MNLLLVLLLGHRSGRVRVAAGVSLADVILAEKFLGLDPTASEMILLLVMLPTGTMFAVTACFWHSWRTTYFAPAAEFPCNGRQLMVATAATGVVKLLLLQLIPSFLGMLFNFGAGFASPGPPGPLAGDTAGNGSTAFADRRGRSRGARLDLPNDT